MTDPQWINNKGEGVDFEGPQTVDAQADRETLITAELMCSMVWDTHRAWEYNIGEGLDEREFGELEESEQDRIASSVRWLIEHPTASISAQHDAWRSRTKFGDTEGHPNAKPFDELPFAQQMKARLWRHVILAMIGCLAAFLVVVGSNTAFAECLRSAKEVRAVHGTAAHSYWGYRVAGYVGQKCWSNVPLIYGEASGKEGERESRTHGSEKRRQTPMRIAAQTAIHTRGVALSAAASFPPKRITVSVVDLLLEMGWVDYLLQVQERVDIVKQRWKTEGLRDVTFDNFGESCTVPPCEVQEVSKAP